VTLRADATFDIKCASDGRSFPFPKAVVEDRRESNIHHLFGILNALLNGALRDQTLD